MIFQYQSGRWRTGMISVLVLVVVVIALPLLLMRPLIESVASEAIGRRISIEDGFDIDWGWPAVTLRARGLVVANEPWAGTSPMATADKLTVGLDAKALFTAFQVRIPEIALSKPSIHLVRNDAGEGNWPQQAGNGHNPSSNTTLSLGSLVIENGTLNYVDDAANAELTGSFATTASAQDTPTHFKFSGNGRYNEQPLDIQVDANIALNSLPNTAKASADIVATLQSGETRLEVNGLLKQPITRSSLTLRAIGPDPALLYPLLPVPLPSLPPYDVSAKVNREDHQWHLNDISGTFGDSDIAGALKFEVADRWRIAGDLRSKRLDLDDLAAVVGGAPDPSETASTKQRKKARTREQRTTVFSQEPIDIDKLAVSDVAVTYRAASILAGKLPLSDVKFEIVLQRGDLMLQDLTIGMAGGTVAGSIELKATGNTLKTTLDLTLSKVNLRRVLKAYDRDYDAAGTLSGRLSAEATGGSVAAMMASSAPDVVIYMDGGRLDMLLVELAGLDLGEALVGWLSNADTVAIRCALLEMHGKAGVLRERSIVVDTTDTLFLGFGTIDLGKERLNLVLVPRAKDFSILSAQSKIYIHGSLKNPTAGPDPGEALLELLSPIEPGGASDTDCGELVRRATAQAKN